MKYQVTTALLMFLFLSACDSHNDTLPLGNRSSQLTQSTSKSMAINRFKTMSACDCSQQSLWGQTMRDGFLYNVAGTGAAAQGADNILATSSANSTYLGGAAFDSSGNLYFYDTYYYRIRMVPKNDGTYFGQSMTANYVYTIAGDGTTDSTMSSDGTNATSAKLYTSLSALAVDSAGNVFFEDHNHIRVIPTSNSTIFGVSVQQNKVYTIAGASSNCANPSANGTDALSSGFCGISGIGLDSIGNLGISDYNGNAVGFIPKTSGTYYGISMTANKYYKIAGSGGSTLVDADVGTNSAAVYPTSVAFDSNDDLFYIDRYFKRVRMISRASAWVWNGSRAAGYVYTVAGNGSAGYSGDGGGATGASISGDGAGIAFDDQDNLIFGDGSNNVVRIVPQQSANLYGQSLSAYNIYTVAGGGFADTGSIAVTASLGSSVVSIALDGDDHLYIGAGNCIKIVPRCN